MFVDTLVIVAISLCTALLGEALTWLLVYRSERYRRLKGEVERQSKRLERKKGVWSDGGVTTAAAGSEQAQYKKKIGREEERLKNNTRELSMVKMKSMMVIGFTFTALLSMFSSIFEGRVVARLPFEPVSFIRGLSHRSLAGDDYRHCSFIFLYILCTMCIRQNVQKALGFAPSRAASKQSGFFQPPSQHG